MSDDARSPATPCTFVGFEKDAQGCYPLGALIFGTKDCTPPPGACFTSSGETLGDEPPPPPAPPRRKRKPPVSDHAPTPSKAASDRADEATIPDDHADDFKATEGHRITVDVVDDAPAQTATTAAPAPQTAVGELSGLLPKDGSGGSAITVLLALIAVAGGGAGWKFYQSFARQKHEQRMKELELKEKKIELQAEKADDKKDDHKACEAARAADRAALEEKLAALEARLAEAEKAKAEAPKSDDFDLPFDPEELNERISQIEKALKKAPSEKKPSDKKAKKDAKKDA